MAWIARWAPRAGGSGRTAGSPSTVPSTRAGPQEPRQVVVVDPRPEVPPDLGVELDPAGVVGMLAVHRHDPVVARQLERVVGGPPVAFRPPPVAQRRQRRPGGVPVGGPDEEVEVGHRPPERVRPGPRGQDRALEGHDRQAGRGERPEGRRELIEEPLDPEPVALVLELEPAAQVVGDRRRGDGRRRDRVADEERGEAVGRDQSSEGEPGDAHPAAASIGATVVALPPSSQPPSTSTIGSARPRGTR